MPAKRKIQLSSRNVLRLYRSGVKSIKAIVQKLEVNTVEGKRRVRQILESNGYRLRRYIWTAEEVRFLRSQYPTVDAHIIARKLKRPLCSIYGKANIMGLHKSPAWWKKKRLYWNNILSRAGKAHRFKQGHITWNDGLKDWQSKIKLSPEKMANIRRGQFRKGNYSKRWKGFRNGMVHLRADRGGRIYKMIRLAPGKWEYYHRHLWRKHHGRIPRGKLVVFKNFNIRDCRPGNLMLIDRKEHGRRWSQTAGSIARQLAIRKGGKGLVDRKVFNQVLNNPALIAVKRAQLQLHRRVNDHG